MTQFMQFNSAMYYVFLQWCAISNTVLRDGELFLSFLHVSFTALRKLLLKKCMWSSN